MRRAIAKSLSYVVRTGIACVCLYLTDLSAAWASVDICKDPSTYSKLSVAFDEYNDSTIDNGPAAVGQKNNDFDLIFKKMDGKWLFGAGHRYSIFDIDPLQPANNGHLHTFFLPLHRLTENDRDSFRFSIAPALSASSNVFDNRKITNDALQILAALVWGRRLSDQTSLRYGICGDHRFVVLYYPGNFIVRWCRWYCYYLFLGRTFPTVFGRYYDWSFRFCIRFC